MLFASEMACFCLRGSSIEMKEMKTSSDRNRSRFDIIAEILRKLREPACKTNIMSYCNMSSHQSGEYLSFMSLNDLIQIDGVPGKVTYQRTQAGRQFLEVYNRMVLLLEPNISAPSLIWQWKTRNHRLQNCGLTDSASPRQCCNRADWYVWLGFFASQQNIFKIALSIHPPNIGLISVWKETVFMDIGAYFELLKYVLMTATFVVLILIFLYVLYGKEEKET